MSRSYFDLLPSELVHHIFRLLPFFDQNVLCFTYSDDFKSPSFVQRQIAWFEFLEQLANEYVWQKFLLIEPIKQPCIIQDTKRQLYFYRAKRMVFMYLPQYFYCNDDCPEDDPVHWARDHIRFGVPPNDPHFLYDGDYSDIMFHESIKYVFY